MSAVKKERMGVHQYTRWTFFYGTHQHTVKVDYDRHYMQTVRKRRYGLADALDIADAVMAKGGILCGDCLTESPVRFVRIEDPNVARCQWCYKGKYGDVW